MKQFILNTKTKKKTFINYINYKNIDIGWFAQSVILLLEEKEEEESLQATKTFDKIMKKDLSFYEKTKKKEWFLGEFVGEMDSIKVFCVFYSHKKFNFIQN